MWLIAAVVLGCSGGDRGKPGNGVDGGELDADASTSEGATKQPLAGSWEARTPGGEAVGTVELQQGFFSATFGDWNLTYSAANGSPTLAGRKYGGANQPINLTHSPASLDCGGFPIDLSGSWNIVEPQTQCTATVGEAAISAGCFDLWNIGYPYLPDRSGMVVGERTAAKDSIFGSVGGDWFFRAPDRENGCTVTFEGNSFSANCPREAGYETGSIQVTIEGNVLSGSTSDGVEISAVRL